MASFHGMFPRDYSCLGNYLKEDMERCEGSLSMAWLEQERKIMRIDLSGSRKQKTHERSHFGF